MSKKAKPQTLYSVRTGKSLNNDTMFIVSKLSEDFEVLAVYNIHETSAHGLTCSCPAHIAFCRHCQMLRIFQVDGRIDSGAFYNFDKKTWLEPNKHEV